MLSERSGVFGRRRFVALVAMSVSLCGTFFDSVAFGALTFDPAPGWSSSEVWSGSNASHFAVDGGAFYIYGAEITGTDGDGNPVGQNVVRRFDGVSMVEIARSPQFSGGAYSPDAITVVDGDVYWAHVQSFSAERAASVFKTSFDGSQWVTSTVLDESAGENVFGLSTDGNRVYGVGSSGDNVAFFFDDNDDYTVLAELDGFSGGSGFDPDGNFYAGSFDFADGAKVRKYSPAQIAERVSGVQTEPYSVSDAVDSFEVPGTGSPVMESDGASLFGREFDATFRNANPYAFDLQSNTSSSLGTLSGAASNNISTDVYARDGSVFFLGRDGFGPFGEAAIFHLVPEPATLGFMLCGCGLILNRRRR